MKAIKKYVILCVLLCLGITSFGQKVLLIITTEHSQTEAIGMIVEHRALPDRKWYKLHSNNVIDLRDNFITDKLLVGAKYAFSVRLVS